MRSYKYDVKEKIRNKKLHISPLLQLENFFKKGKI